jgi:hypothetical protein
MGAVLDATGWKSNAVTRNLSITTGYGRTNDGSKYSKSNLDDRVGLCSKLKQWTANDDACCWVAGCRGSDGENGPKFKLWRSSLAAANDSRTTNDADAA